MSAPYKRMLFLALILLIFGLLVVSGYISRYFFNRFDPIVRKTFVNVEAATSYEEYEQTSLLLPDKKLSVESTYIRDARNQRYYSKANTTLDFNNGNSPISFSVTNITIGQDLYTRVESHSKARLSVPADGKWKHFKISSVPSAYTNIAEPGPILDSLKLFENGGAYLSLVSRNGAHLQGASLLLYKFKLASLNTAGKSSAATLMKRIGRSGSIDVWIDPSDDLIRMFVLHNGSYTSTTTVMNYGEPSPIAAPVATHT